MQPSQMREPPPRSYMKNIIFTGEQTGQLRSSEEKIGLYLSVTDPTPTVWGRKKQNVPFSHLNSTLGNAQCSGITARDPSWKR